MSVIAVDTASRTRAWVVRTGDDGSMQEHREVRGGALDRELAGAITALLDDDLTAVVSLTGPGAYSGVRAGMAAALGLATARGIPIHGLDNLTALAVAAGLRPAEVCVAAFDAGRGGVYVARFAGEEPRPRQLAPAERVAIADVPQAGRVVAAAEIDGLAAEVLDPVRVLCAAVPVALASVPLPAAGLQATHAAGPASGTPQPGATGR